MKKELEKPKQALLFPALSHKGNKNKVKNNTINLNWDYYHVHIRFVINILKAEYPQLGEDIMEDAAKDIVTDIYYELKHYKHIQLGLIRKMFKRILYKKYYLYAMHHETPLDVLQQKRRV